MKILLLKQAVRGKVIVAKMVNLAIESNKKVKFKVS